jgi:hypothetical protein
MLASAAVSGQATAVRAGSRTGGAVGAGEQEDDAVTSAVSNCWGAQEGQEGQEGEGVVCQPCPPPKQSVVAALILASSGKWDCSRRAAPVPRTA